MSDKILLDRPVITEGKYDKIKLSSIIDAEIIVTDGFGIFKDSEKKKYLRRLAEKNGVFVLTDSDGAGLVIRNEIHSILPADKITDLYIPEISGKEKRKKAPSKEGLIGVEGIDADIVRSIFERYRVNGKEGTRPDEISRARFYDDGYIGKSDSAKKRKALCAALSLPTNLSSSALLRAINDLCLSGEYCRIIKETETKE